jgi:hypothetical protein
MHDDLGGNFWAAYKKMGICKMHIGCISGVFAVGGYFWRWVLSGETDLFIVRICCDTIA